METAQTETCDRARLRATQPAQTTCFCSLTNALRNRCG